MCIADGGEPQPQITWYIDTQPVKNGEESQYFGANFVKGTLDVVMYREMDEKHLVCEARNGVGDPVRINTTLTVQCKFPIKDKRGAPYMKTWWISDH